jgi:Tetracyclin repressor-like, C-terminal domain
VNVGSDRRMCRPKLLLVLLGDIGGALSRIGRWYRPDGPLGSEAIAEHCIAVLVNGLATRAG